LSLYGDFSGAAALISSIVAYYAILEILMPERIPPTAVFYGSAKPETAKPPAKDSRFVTGVKKAVNS
jgi:hypothetical protein